MESHLPILAFIVTGLTISGVFTASRSAMSGVVKAAKDITWAHAVNSKDALEKALASSVDFLEADISLGHVKGFESIPAIPIMAHPPDIISDISLETWLNIIVEKRPDKGIKLDFKSLEVVEPSFIILQKYASKLNSPVWLNADVLSGPVNSPTNPVQAEKFLTLCDSYFPNATLSIGWTTRWYPTFTEDTWHYGWEHVRLMADVIRCHGYKRHLPNITFPVRGIFVSRSIKQFQWLLSIVPNSTLTVWSHEYDALQLDHIITIRMFFPEGRIYYDIPEDINKENRNLHYVDCTHYNFTAGNDHWRTISKGLVDRCSTFTYVKNDIILFGKSLTTAVLRKDLIVYEENGILKISGKIKFFNSGERRVAEATRGMQELSIILADVSLFAKNESENTNKDIDLTDSDSEVIWSAINSSIIYTIEHKYDEENSSCYFFKIDPIEYKSFQVWAVPCDVMLENDHFDDISEIGSPEISSGKHLVLPKNPFMLGFVSTGDEHIVIYDLIVEGQTLKDTNSFTQISEGHKFLSHSQSLPSLGLVTMISLLTCIYFILF